MYALSDYKHSFRINQEYMNSLFFDGSVLRTVPSSRVFVLFFIAFASWLMLHCDHKKKGTYKTIP